MFYPPLSGPDVVTDNHISQHHIMSRLLASAPFAAWKRRAIQFSRMLENVLQRKEVSVVKRTLLNNCTNSCPEVLPRGENEALLLRNRVCYGIESIWEIFLENVQLA